MTFFEQTWCFRTPRLGQSNDPGKQDHPTTTSYSCLSHEKRNKLEQLWQLFDDRGGVGWRADPSQNRSEHIGRPTGSALSLVEVGSWGGWVDLRPPDAPRGITLPRGPAIYAVANAQTWDELLFIGFKWDMNAAYASFARRAGDSPLPALRAYTEGEQNMPEYQLRELVGDLIGGYFSAKREPPRLQF